MTVPTGTYTFLPWLRRGVANRIDTPAGDPGVRQRAGFDVEVTVSGVGLDGLQKRGHTVVFGELDWSPQVHKQVIGRLRRPGQTRQVDAIYLIADGGADPAIVRTLGLKGSQSAGIVDPLKPVEAQHSDATRIRRLAELYLQGKSYLAAPAGVGNGIGNGDRARPAPPVQESLL